MDLIDDYVTYWQGVEASHVSLRSISFGGVEEILGMERASMEYPAIWVEIPDIVPDWETGRTPDIKLRGAIAILYPSEVGDINGKINALHVSWQVVYDILGKVDKEWKERQPKRIDPASIVIEPLISVANNNNHGWRMEFTMHTKSLICYNNTGNWR
jgi:hypothetical protein